MLINQPNSRKTHGEASLVLISLYWIVAIHQESLTVGDVIHVWWVLCCIPEMRVFKSPDLQLKLNQSTSLHGKHKNNCDQWYAWLLPNCSLVNKQMIYWRLKIQCCSGEHPIVTQNDWTVSKINDMGKILYIYMPLTKFNHWNLIYAVIIIQLFFVAKAKTMVQCYPLVIKHDHQNILPLIDDFPIIRPLSSEITHVWYPFVPIYPISYPPWFLIFSISFTVKTWTKNIFCPWFPDVNGTFPICSISNSCFFLTV